MKECDLMRRKKMKRRASVLTSNAARRNEMTSAMEFMGRKRKVRRRGEEYCGEVRVRTLSSFGPTSLR